MTHAEFEALPAAIAAWLERRYIAADGKIIRSHSFDRTLVDGTVAEVKQAYATETQLDVFYQGKI